MIGRDEENIPAPDAPPRAAAERQERVARVVAQEPPRPECIRFVPITRYRKPTMVVASASSSNSVLMRGRDGRLLCRPVVQMEMYVPRGTGRLAFSPAAFVMVKTVSSALLFGMSEDGGKWRRVSLKTLRSAPRRAVGECSRHRYHCTLVRAILAVTYAREYGNDFMSSYAW